jgi:tetratricopeptide (TPR) repeat protein
VDAEGAARRAREGTAVSSGDSSAAQRPAALNPDGQPQPEPDLDATLPQGAPSPVPMVNRAAAGAQPKSDPSDAATVAEGRRPRDPSSGSTQQVFASIGATIFEVGSVLGGRYEIQALLGMGGMGAVYKAHDLEVDRAVGLKVIRPDLAGNPAILARFKQELILARQVTHKNIIRIYDLSEAEGVKFITMEFIEGEDLRTILTRQGKLTSDEAIGIMRQACIGLQAAHAEGVIHRDLKPSNIMRDMAGRVVIMDFGLAKTVTGDGMTQTGMMIGTMEYMSPEQAMGAELDARSDIFAVGLIFYELMTGNMPYRADSAIASLVKRTQERAVPLNEVDPTVPAAVSHIVSKCLERDPKNRYSSIQELVDDLNVAQGKVPGQTGLRAGVPSADVAVTEGVPSPAIPAPAIKKTAGFPRMWLAIAVVLMAVLGVSGYFGYKRFVNHATSASTAAISVAIIPYYNASGDATLDSLSSTLSETLSTDVATSAGIHLISQSRLQQVLGDLRISAQQQQLDLSQLRRIAEITSADTVVTGNYVKLGNQIRINSTVYDGILKGDRQFNIVTNVAADENNLTSSISQLSLDVRDKLASNAQMLEALESSASPKLTNSAPALSAYSEGLQLYQAGKYPEAAKQFENATGDDPTFAMAFSQLGLAYKQLGNDDKAQVASNKAVTLSDSLPASQKFLIQANNAIISNDTANGIIAYEKLTKANPDDSEAQLALARLYENAGRYDDARSRLAKVRALDANNAEVLYYSGRLEIQADKPQDALDPLSKAYSLATQSGNDQLRSDILQSQGLVYQKLNRPQEALKNVDEALEIRRRLNLPAKIGSSLAGKAAIQEQLGDGAGALASYKESLTIRRSLSDKRGTALTLMGLGNHYHNQAKYDDALKYYNEALNDFRDLGDQSNQALCLNNIGSAYNGLSNYQAALTNFAQSYEISDKLKQPGGIARALHNLADMNVKIGQYDDAVAQYVKGIDNATQAGDEDQVALVSTSLGELYATQGQYGQALKSYDAAIKGFQAANDHTYLMGTALAGYGRVLSMVGRAAEGQPKLQEAVKLLTDVNNNEHLAEALNWLGDSYMYAGKFDDARQQYKKAAETADRAKSREQSALSRFGLARLDILQGHGAAAIPVLRKLGQETDALGLKALSVQASLYLARAELAANKPQLADQELARALNRADKLGLIIEKAQAHYLMGALATVTNKEKQLGSEYRDTVNTLETISKQPGMEHLLDREDLKGMYQDALKSAFQGT